MKWKQFFTPVKSINAEQGHKMVLEKPSDELAILDVRQPREYEDAHIPGSTLIPIPELMDRLGELDKSKTTLVYCAIGGRSRIAAQMLSGEGFNEVYNLSGGIKAWDYKVAVGDEREGLEQFSGSETPDRILAIAYSLEEALHAFYVSMIDKVEKEDAKKLFKDLASIEILHQNRILDEYCKITGKNFSRGEFEENVVMEEIEGGLTTEEYTNMFQPDWENLDDIISVAMSIEAQALDLYLRVSGKSDDPRSKEVLSRIANEERTHLARLGSFLDQH